MHRRLFTLGAYLLLSFAFAVGGKEKSSDFSMASTDVFSSTSPYYNENEEVQCTLMPYDENEYALLGWTSKLIRRIDLKKKCCVAECFFDDGLVSFVIPHNIHDMVLVGKKSDKKEFEKIEIYDKHLQHTYTIEFEADCSLKWVVFRPEKDEFVVCSRNKKNGKCKVEVLSCSGTILWTFDYLDKKTPKISFDESGNYFCLFDDHDFSVCRLIDGAAYLVSIEQSDLDSDLDNEYSIKEVRYDNLLGLVVLSVNTQLNQQKTTFRICMGSRALRDNCSLFKGEPLLSLSDDGKVFAYVSEECVFLLDVNNMIDRKLCSCKKPIWFIKLNKNGSRLLIGTDNGVSLFDTKTRKIMGTKQCSDVSSASFLPNKDGFIAFRENGNCFWGVRRE